MSCDWPIDVSCLPALPDPEDPGYAKAVAVREAAQVLAVQVLWALSARQFGICSYLTRPCPDLAYWRRARLWSGAPFVPVFEGGAWRNIPCGCVGHCSLISPRTIHLPGPVVDITEITIGDTVLPEDEYVREGNVVYRRDRDWPTQNLALPLGDNGTWSVEYTRGQPVPEGVAMLTALLAAEFVNICTDSKKCRLPRNVKVTNRNGVAYQVYDASAMYRAGKTGLDEVDSWLAAVNPNRLQSAPEVI